MSAPEFRQKWVSWGGDDGAMVKAVSHNALDFWDRIPPLCNFTRCYTMSRAGWEVQLATINAVIPFI